MLICRLRRAPLGPSLALCLLASGCTVGPNFVTPRADVPASYQASVSTKGTPYVSGDAVDPQWWKIFGDPELTALETQAVSQNLDLQIATERLLEAQAQAQVEGAVLYPSLGAAGSYTREGPSKKGIFTAFGGQGSTTSTNAGTIANGASGAFGGGGVSGSAIQPLDLYQYGLQAIYDVDLWGKNRRAVEAAIAAARASQEARRASLINVQAQVATNYIQLRGTETVLNITQRNLDAANQLVKLTHERQAAGLTTALDVANAKALAAQIAAQIPSLTASRDRLVDQLCLLLGVLPGSLSPSLSQNGAVPLTPPEVAIGLPSDLLRRRPDVREAEASLHKATAEVGVAVAAFFPDISLTGSVSLQALQFKNLNELAAITYAVGPNISLPIFEGGQLHGQLSLRRAQQREAAIKYAQTVLTAFNQVDVALAIYTDDHASLAALGDDVKQSQIALGLAEDQYRQGLADYLTVLNAQQSYLAATQSQAQAVEKMSVDLVTLYQALGGGWEGVFPAAKRSI